MRKIPLTGVKYLPERFALDSDSRVSHCIFYSYEFISKGGKNLKLCQFYSVVVISPASSKKKVAKKELNEKMIERLSERMGLPRHRGYFILKNGVELFNKYKEE